MEELQGKIVGEIHADEILYFLSELRSRPTTGGFCTIRADSVAGKPQTMRVTYTPVTDGKPGVSHTYTISGDEWLLVAEVLRWENWVNIFFRPASSCEIFG